jgi:hypothetical protein
MDMLMNRTLVSTLALTWLLVVPLRGDVLINELMYHPSSQDVREEYIELYNAGTNTVDLTGWRFSKGVSFTFSNVVLAPRAYLVVAANRTVFQGKYPGVPNVVGDWVGTLRNNGEEIQLENALGQAEDSVTYANSGDWGTRRVGLFQSGSRGWEWFADHDGGGKSLELIQPSLPNSSGQNWGSSLPFQGTPGVANSLLATNVAPLLLDVQHSPAVPQSIDPVAITARLRDEAAAGITVTLHWRLSSSSPPNFESTTMFDDGEHQDGVAGDGIYGAVLPQFFSGAVVEYYVEAVDIFGAGRTWPAPALPALDQGGLPFQGANALYQVDDEVYPGPQPMYRLVLTVGEQFEFLSINRNSDAQMNVTFISTEGTGTEVRHNCAVRIRGAGSRSRTPPNYRLNIPNDQLWHGVEEINLNTQYTHSQIAGSHLVQKSGMVAANARPVQVRLNGLNQAFDTPQPGNIASWQFGSYVHLEVLGGDWAARHLPDDGDGNAYRASSGSHSATLSYGTTPEFFLSRGYSKTSNQSENDWSDLIHLTDVLNNTPDSNYVAAVSEVVNVELWMRYFAVMTMLTSLETSIASGNGDDYSLYRGVVDPRFILLPHDLDTCMGEGDSGAQPNTALFRMVGTGVPVLGRFMTNNAFVPLYFNELQRMLDTTFSAPEFNALLDRVLGGWIPQPDIERMKSYQVQRNNFIRSQIPLSLTATSSLPVVNGFSTSTSGTAALNGRANVLTTRFVRVNGLPANWLNWQGVWNITGLALSPGINRILVQTFDAATNELQRLTYDVWYNDSSVVSVSGTLASDTSWSAAAGPYQVTSTVTVPDGVTLTIEAGTSVYFAAGAGLVVNGVLAAQGTPERHIRFGRAPGSTGVWSGLTFDESAAENRISYADFDFADGGSANINVASSRLELDHITWNNTTKTILSTIGASVAVWDSVFPSLPNATHIVGNSIPSGGFFVIGRNTFGSTAQRNDVIQFRGAQRPSRVLQVLDNIFTAASDDVLDLDGTDAHVEGNLFLHVRRNHAVVGDTANAISAGRFGGNAASIVAVRNLFFDVDHVVLVKDGATVTLVNNTVVGVQVAAVNFSEPELGTLPGAGAILDGNIFFNSVGFSGTNFQQRFPTNGNVQLSLQRNLFSSTDGVTNGVGENLVGDPRLFNTVSNTLTAATLRRDFALRAGSPALGTGPNGLDRGALVPAGASISGIPPSPTSANSVTISLGGPGISNVLYRLNGGPYSQPRPVGALTLSNLANGTYTLEVLGINSAGSTAASPTLSRAWTVDSSLQSVLLNEVFAWNDGWLDVEGQFPDLLEFYNPGLNPLDLSGVGVTDNPDEPYRFAFPAGTVLGAGQYLLVAGGPSSEAMLGLEWAVERNGGGVYVYASSQNGGTLLDSITFGPQARNFSIGRLAAGGWGLVQPTLGGPNVPQPTGDPALLRINEWLTSAQSAFGSDFIELYNGDSLPVGLGGLFLTDEPAGAPRRHAVPPLSFVEGNGHSLFLADGKQSGGHHLSFKLDPAQGLIALLSSTLKVLDCVIYGPQTTDLSEGRVPSGGTAFAFFPNPTPGAGNPRGSGTNANFLVALNEVLANNGSFTNSDGSITDWVELLAGPSNTVDLADMSLSDDSATPRRWVFPPGTSLAPGARLVVQFDPDSPPTTNSSPTLNTGFGLNASGDQVYLFDAPARNGALLDAVSFGLQAADFSIGRLPEATGVWQLNRVTRGAPNLAASLGSAAALRVNEWLADPDSGDDWFELYNPNPQPVALGGMSFSDDVAVRRRSPIPALSFIGTVTNGYARFVADNQPGNGADHVAFKLDKDGDTIALFPAGNGPAIDLVTFGAQAKGVSEGRFPDGANRVVRFPRTPSPAEPNFLPLDHVVISEALTHTDLPLEDAIELQNLSSQPVDVSYWFLSDSNNDPKKYQIPNGTVIAPGGFVVFYEYQFNPEPGKGQSFSLSSSGGDRVLLSTADAGGGLTGFRSSVRFGPAENAVSFVRYETSVGPEFPAATALSMGSNSPGTVEQFRLGLGESNAAPRVGPVVIHEIHYHPPDSGTNDNVLDEFIELRNTAGVAVPLFDPAFPTNTWRLRDAVDFEFPQNVSLPAGGYLLLVSFAPTNTSQVTAFRNRYGLAPSTPLYGPYRGKLDNSSDSVELLKPDAPQVAPSPDAGLVPYVLVERVHYHDKAPWPILADGNTNGLGMSLQRRNASSFADDPVNWQAGVPTPAAATGAPGLTLPAISQQPASQVSAEGNTVNYTVAVTGAAPFTYQWRFNGIPIPGAIASTLTLPSVNETNEGRYAVLISNPAGAVSSGQATLRLQTPPQILVQPVSHIVVDGASASFSVVARGSSPLSFQWRRQDVALPGQTGTNLFIPVVHAANEGAYTVVVSNNFGTTTSLVAQLTINTPPSITTQPQSLTVNAGDPATFSVGLGGSPPFLYQWYFNTEVLPGQTNATLTLDNVQGSAAGNYNVSVSNAVGSLISATATLTVVLPPIVSVIATDSAASEAGLNPGAFRISRSYVTNTALTVNVVIDGTAGNGVDYESLASPVTIPANQSSVTVPVIPREDALKEPVETIRLTLAPGSRYVIDVQNSATVSLFDNDNQPPSVNITQPVAGILFPFTPTNVALAVAASDPDGTVALVEYFWAGTNKIAEATVPPFNAVWFNAPSGSNALVAVATDNLGASVTSAPVFFVLNTAPTVAITSPANNSGFRTGTNVLVNATAADSDGTVTQVQFFVEGVLLEIDVTAPYTATLVNPMVGTYNLTARATDDRGASRDSDPVTILVNTGNLALTDSFAARNVVTGTPLVVLGSNTNTTSEAQEPDPLRARNARTVWIAWTAPTTGQAVVDTVGSDFDTVLAVYTGGTLSTLNLMGANDDFRGLQSQVSFNAAAGTTYQIQVAGFSSEGNVGNIVLNITAALSSPFIALQPQSRTVPLGTNVAFSVGAFGSPPLSYQWRRDGVALPGATTATLTLQNVQASQEGGYSVVVSNPLGASTSVVATLTVDDGLISVQRTTLVPLHQTWRFNQSGSDPGAAWRNPGYDDSSWNTGQTLFGFEDTVPNPYFEPFRTPLRAGAGSPVTTLFRVHFQYTNSLSTPVTLVSSNWIDDGAVFFLNGMDAGRIRMLAGVTDFFALASSQASPEGQVVVLQLPTTNLLAGDNVLAVQVHQTSFNNADVVFGSTLDAVSVTTNAPVLSQPVPLQNGGWRLTLTGIAGRRYALETASPLGAPWTQLTIFSNFTGQATYTDATSPANATRFYRARVSQ